MMSLTWGALDNRKGLGGNFWFLDSRVYMRFRAWGTEIAWGVDTSKLGRQLQNMYLQVCNCVPLYQDGRKKS